MAKAAADTQRQIDEAIADCDQQGFNAGLRAMNALITKAFNTTVKLRKEIDEANQTRANQPAPRERQMASRYGNLLGPPDLVGQYDALLEFEDDALVLLALDRGRFSAKCRPEQPQGSGVVGLAPPAQGQTPSPPQHGEVEQPASNGAFQPGANNQPPPSGQEGPVKQPTLPLNEPKQPPEQPVQPAPQVEQPQLPPNETFQPPRQPTDLEIAVLREINDARGDPPAYARRLHPEPYVDLSDAQAFLAKQPPVPAIAYDPRLAKVAIAQEEDQGPRGGESHTGSDGSRPSERMRGVGVQTTEYAEVISIGMTTAGDVAEQLIVDQPGPLHPHRMDLFDPNLVVAGVGCGPNSKFVTMCVIDLASRYAPLPPPPPPP